MRVPGRAPRGHLAGHRPSAWRRLSVVLVIAAAVTAPQAPVSAAQSMLPASPVGRRLQELYLAGDAVEARELAETVLAEHPDSYEAHYVLGRVLYEFEFDLPKARYHLVHALESFDAACREDGKGCGPDHWRWRARILRTLAYLAGDMDRREEQLDWIAKYEDRYSPPLVGVKAWALMKLGQYDRAEAVAYQGIGSSDQGAQDSGWTALCAISAERGDLERSYSTCLAAAHRMDDRPDDGTVEYRNAGHGSLYLFRYPEAESLFQEATRRPTASYSNPWADLAYLYTISARLAEAVQAMIRARSYVYGRFPAYVFADRARLDQSAATVLMIAGRLDAALTLVRRAVVMPDRLGGTSAHQDQELAGASLLWRAVAKASSERERELSSTLPPWRRPGRWLARLRLWSSIRTNEAKIRSLLTRGDLLVSSLRPYFPRSSDAQPWLAMDLVEILGPGVVAAGLERARAQETREGARPFFEGLEAEVMLRLGDEDQAYHLAVEALGSLPRAEKLLAARLHAIAALAARMSDARGLEVQHLERMMAQDPGLLRRLGVTLPVCISGEGGAPALARLLEASPRLRAVDGGPCFRVELGDGDPCLLTPHGARLGCASDLPGPSEVGGDPARVAMRFYDAISTPRIDMTQQDVVSLEGSPVSATPAAARMKGFLDLLGPGRTR